MKFYISADIEGVTGVSTWDEAQDIGSYESRVQMTREVAAVCEVLAELQDVEIIVKDAHGKGKNLIHEQLPECVQVISGWSEHPYNMVEGLGATFDGVFFIGYHSAAGSENSPLAHTLNPRLIRELRIDGKLCSELDIHARIAKDLGVPVCLVTGDEGIVNEAALLGENIQTVAVKSVKGGAVTGIHPSLAIRKIKEATKRSLEQLGRVEPIKDKLMELQVTFKKHQDAYRYSFFPGVEQVDAFTISLKTDRYMDILTLLIFM